MMKEAFVNRDLLSEGVKLHVTCSLLASFATCTAGNPLDVVRTRLYNQPRGLNGEGLLYKSWLEAFYKIPATEGLGALYKVRGRGRKSRRRRRRSSSRSVRPSQKLSAVAARRATVEWQGGSDRVGY